MGPGDEENAGTALYAFHQTIEYNPPPVVNGRIPKNVYGNLDLYVPSMVPAGAVHLKHPETQRAAKLLGVDYADAVTGFAFKGRHGTAIINGAVVASEYAEAVQEVLSALEDERAYAEEARRTLEALRMWKRLLAGLRIRERIEGYEVEGERDTTYEQATSGDDAVSDEVGGGFLPDPVGEPIAEPTAGRAFYQEDNRLDGYLVSGVVDWSVIGKQGNSHQVSEDSAGKGEENGGGGFLVDGYDEDAEEVMLDHGRKDIQNHGYGEYEDCEGGGFLVDDDGTEAPEAIRKTEPKGIDETTLPAPISKHPMQHHVQQGGHSEQHSPGNSRGESKQKVAIKPSESPSDAGSHLPDLGLADEELAEATILQQSYESRNSITQPIIEELGPEHSLIGLSSGLEDYDTNERREQSLAATPEALVPSQSASAQPTPRIAATSDDSEDETGSLLAEDPSDEDADPEWLA